jgi:hypothetical protein
MAWSTTVCNLTKCFVPVINKWLCTTWCRGGHQTKDDASQVTVQIDAIVTLYMFSAPFFICLVPKTLSKFNKTIIICLCFLKLQLLVTVSQKYYNFVPVSKNNFYTPSHLSASHVAESHMLDWCSNPLNLVHSNTPRLTSGATSLYCTPCSNSKDLDPWD